MNEGEMIIMTLEKFLKQFFTATKIKLVDNNTNKVVQSEISISRFLDLFSEFENWTVIMSGIDENVLTIYIIGETFKVGDKIRVTFSSGKKTVYEVKGINNLYSFVREGTKGTIEGETFNGYRSTLDGLTQSLNRIPCDIERIR